MYKGVDVYFPLKFFGENKITIIRDDFTFELDRYIVWYRLLIFGTHNSDKPLFLRG